VRSLLRLLTDDDRGNVAVIASFFLTVVLGCAALGVDLGKAFTDRRAAQGATDLAAISAASDIANATRAATATAQQNHYPASAITSVVTGIYTPDPALPVAQRFQPAASTSSNAARVTLETSAPLIFGKIITGQESFPIRTTATATQTGFASFAIGSGLASVNGGLLNQLLSALLGANLSLSAMDYQSLLDTKLDLFSFSQALATRANLTAASYDALLQSNVRISDFVNAMVDTTRASGASSAAGVLNNVFDAVRGMTSQVPLASLMNLGPYAHLALGEKPQVGASVAALDLLSAAAQIANGAHQVETNLALNIPGIAGVNLKVAIGERPRGTSWIAVGTTGASVHTAQTRVLLTIQLVGTGAISVIKLPIYIEIASATARLERIQCSFPSPSGTTVGVSATPAVLDGWIGAVSNSEFTNFTSAPNPPPAKLVDIPLVLKVTGLAHATITNLTPASLTFTHADITQQAKKTVNTTDYLTSLVSQLLGNLTLEASLLGIGLGLPSAITQTVSQILTAATPAIDQVLATTLGALGIGVGQAHIWVTGVRCDGAVLVN